MTLPVLFTPPLPPPRLDRNTEEIIQLNLINDLSMVRSIICVQLLVQVWCLAAYY